MRFAIILFVAFMLTAFSAAQPDKAQVDALLLKVKKVDLLNHILPLLMTKDQIKKVLPAVEKARQRVKDAQTKEFNELKKFEAKLDDANKKGMESGLLPGRTLLDEITKMFARLAVERAIIAQENTEALMKVLKETLNPGQIKAAVNDLNPKLFDPSLKPEEMSSDQKLEFYVREIFLDPSAYDVLVQLSKTGTPGGGG